MRSYLPTVNDRPLIRTIPLSGPFSALYELFAENGSTGILDSALRTDAGRYSYIGISPFAEISAVKDRISLNLNGHKIRYKDDPFNALNSMLAAFPVIPSTGVPFEAGAIGYFSYDLKDVIEELPSLSRPYSDIPDMRFVFYRALLIHDSEIPDRAILSVLDIHDDSGVDAGRLADDIQNRIACSPPRPDKETITASEHEPELARDLTESEYIRAVQRILDHIHAGDIYQACLTQRFSSEWKGSGIDLFRRLRSVNPAPFSAFLESRDACIISSSPEMFLKIDNGRVETRPMKGTRPRNGSPAHDRAMKRALETSAKDAAELAMIVDLERNDLGKVCGPGSIQVDEHRRIEEYASVFQTISRVTGVLQKGTPMTEVVKACFPGGSITGCPKIRAMEILEELEPCKRHVYCGSIGYISLHDTLQLNIAIRTLLARGRKVYFHTGSGIVADSDPSLEYRESLDKASALIRALGPDDKTVSL
ncbi:MAG: aminodeoxychorismate synthase component I [Candidatus Omnitrophica bacterium]|nr:aminodeoxychorismate synthase component I [Candidatus Omnitrophota bacterium]